MELLGLPLTLESLLIFESDFDCLSIDSCLAPLASHKPTKKMHSGHGYSVLYFKRFLVAASTNLSDEYSWEKCEGNCDS